MKRYVSALAATAALAVTVMPQAKAETKKAPTLAVWPRSVESLPIITLGSLVAAALPRGNAFSWSQLQIPSVRWITEGIKAYRVGGYYREGLVRVRAAGNMSRILRQNWEELSWSIEMTTEGNQKWGPTSIRIQPGINNTAMGSDYDCFGTAFTGCTFPLAAISHPTMKLTKQCEFGNGSDKTVVLAASTTDGRRGTVAYYSSAGSGGSTNSIEVSPMGAREFCAERDDGDY